MPAVTPGTTEPTPRNLLATATPYAVPPLPAIEKVMAATIVRTAPVLRIGTPTLSG